MLRITFLGTGGSTPTKERSLPSVALEHEGEMLLFDCGEGTQMQAMKYSLNISKIDAIFITHTHGDHVIGLAGLVRTLALNKRAHPLQIYVPAGEEKKIVTLMTFDKALIGYGIEIKGVRSGVVRKGDDYEVSAFKLSHRVPTYGYVFRENDKIHFKKEKCKRLGIKGTMFSEMLKRGFLTIRGKRVKLRDVSYKVPGKKIVYATDTRPVKTTIDAARGADVLIHESSYAESHKKFARERFHSTAKEAADVARKARCKSLVLFHMSARYKNTAPLQNEARQVFKNTTVAKDGMTINLGS